MGKILAIDFGRKRVGYAVSDEKRTMAFPRAAVSAEPITKLLEHFKKIAKEEGIAEVVIGVPLDKENLDTKTSVEIRRFGEKLGRFLNLPLKYVDEFNSTREALSKIPLRADRRKMAGVADAVAAQIILERYLGL